MTITHPYDNAALHEYQADVNDLLLRSGVASELWHSGGGIFGVRVTTPAGNQLFTTFETPGTPGEAAWLAFDYTDDDGDMIAALSIEVRPFGGAHPHDPAEAAVQAVLKLLRGLA